MWSLFSSNVRDFPYQYDEKDLYIDKDSIFIIHQGLNKSQEKVTIFKYDKTKGSQLGCEIVKKGIQKLRTIRHPYILKYVNDFETTSDIYLATERVQPLRSHLTKLHLEKIVLEQYLPKGIMDILKAVTFLNKDAKLKHNNLFAGTVFVTDAGEWKVGDLGFTNAIDEPYPIKPFESLSRYNPPEVLKESCAQTCPTADSWGLGVLMWEVYNGGVMDKRSDLLRLTNIPPNLVEVFCKLIGMPESRLDVDQVLSRCCSPDGYFMNDLIYTLQFIEELHLNILSEKTKFFKFLTQQVHKFPNDIVENRILSALHTAVSYGDTGAAIIDPIMKISSQINDASQYDKLITPCLIKLYQSSDRAVRSKLLQFVPLYIDKMSSDVLNQEIFIQFANGFLDSHHVIRILSVKGALFLAPYLNHNNLNVELLKHFARLQSKDEKEVIRTYVTDYVGKISKYIEPSIRPKILLSAFVRALHDPCCRVKIAGINALVSTQQFFTVNDIAEKILPPLCILTVDPEITVRQNSLKAIKGFVNKLEMVSNNPTLKEDMEKLVSVKADSKVSSTNWGRWAVSAITSTLGTTLGLKTSDKILGGQNVKDGSKVNVINVDKDNMNEDISEISLQDSEDISSTILELPNDENWDCDNWSPIDDFDSSPIDIAALEKSSEKEKDSNYQMSVMNPQAKSDLLPKEIKEQTKVSERHIREQRLTSGHKPAGSSLRSSGPLKLGIKKT